MSEKETEVVQELLTEARIINRRLTLELNILRAGGDEEHRQRALFLVDWLKEVMGQVEDVTEEYR